MGYMALVHSQYGTNHYIITENQDDKNVSDSILSGLSAGEYSILLYMIDEHGVPLEQAAGFSQSVLVHRNSSTIGMLI